MASYQSREARNRAINSGIVPFIPGDIYRRDGSNMNTNCVICLSKLQKDERVVQLLFCLHLFHPKCIRSWFRHNSTCPLCAYVGYFICMTTASYQSREARNCARKPGIVPFIPDDIYQRDASNMNTDCVICLSKLQKGEPVVMLSICLHLFHPECIRSWFRHNSTCPLCRFDYKCKCNN
ncbi:RING-H2 finger protein ATL39-like [Carex rostrata]